MARTPVGTRSQGESRAAAAAHVASRLTGVGTDRSRRDAWLSQQLGVKLRSNGLDRAATHMGDAAWPWLLVDEAKLDLGLQTAFLFFPGSGRPRPRLIAQLKATGSVRQLMVLRSRRDVVCVLLFRQGEYERLFAAVETIGEDFVWEDILHEDRRIEADTWIGLTTQIARDESLLEIPDS
jgi:hypothetical protein